MKSTLYGVPGESFAMTKEQNPNLNQIQPGMDVEDTQDLLGEHDKGQTERTATITQRVRSIETFTSKSACNVFFQKDFDNG